MPASTPSAPIDPTVIRQAAQWLVCLHSGQASPDDHAACERWRRSSAAHEQAWRKAERLHVAFDAVSPALGMTVLTRQPQQGRRAALKTLAMLGTTASLGWMCYRYSPWRDWASDYSSAIGENRNVMLADGSQVLLNTRTAMDVRFSQNVRLVQLQRGEIYVRTAPDTGGLARPFIVQTPQGRLRALGTRFAVRRLSDSDAACLSVFEHRVEVTLRSGGEPRIVEAGQSVRLTERSVLPEHAHSVSQQYKSIDGPAWTHGVLYADNMRLDAFLAELSRYRLGIVHCDPRVAGLRLSGVYQLADTDNILRILEQTLPIQTLSRMKYWIIVTPFSGHAARNQNPS